MYSLDERSLTILSSYLKVFFISLQESWRAYISTSFSLSWFSRSPAFFYSIYSMMMFFWSMSISNSLFRFSRVSALLLCFSFSFFRFFKRIRLKHSNVFENLLIWSHSDSWLCLMCFFLAVSSDSHVICWSSQSPHL